jgi:hypothetical protein
MRFKPLLLFLLLSVSSTFLFAQHQTNCLAFQDKSTQSGWQRWVTKSTTLLQYSDSSAYYYLEEQPQWTIEAGLSYVASGHYFLKMTITLRTNPIGTYPPILAAEMPIQVQFLDDSRTAMRTLTRSSPVKIGIPATYQYEVDIILSKKAVKQLRTKEVDQLSILWQNEWLVFDLYDVDFFKRHFACLDANF